MAPKNFSYGIGFSKKNDSFQATKEAAQKALKAIKGVVPSLTYVFFSSNHDAYKVSDAMKEVFDKAEFIGGSADSVIYNDIVTRNGVLVVSLDCSKNNSMHFGIASADRSSKNPQATAKKVVKEAMQKIPMDKYVDPYVAFTRMKNSSVSWLVKLPSFYIHLFTRGMKVPNIGDETKIIKGISDVIGLQVPIWGGSFGTNTDNVRDGKPYEIYMLHSGKVMKDGLIVCFATSSLLYGYTYEHGCKATSKCGFISKVSNGGFLVEEISGKPVVDWYAEQLGMSKKEFMKDPHFVTQMNPLGIPDSIGNFLIRGGGIPAGKGLAYVAPLIEGWPVYLMEGKPKNLMSASKKIKGDLQDYLKTKEAPALLFTALCVTRKIAYGEKTKAELKKLRKEMGGVPLVGFSCFGETGAKPGQQTRFEHVTLNVFGLYDQLMTKLKR